MSKNKPKLLKKACKTDKPDLKLIVSSIGLILGVLLYSLTVYFALQFFSPVSNVDSQKDYLIISKTVEPGISDAKLRFSDEELNGVKAIAGIEDVSGFLSNHFSASASTNFLFRHSNYHSEIFLEAVPDKFLDFDVKNFEWNEDSETVPLIISADFLALYNFGFAPSRGLPRITPEVVNTIPLNLYVSGKSGSKEFKARVEGVSQRISTILVPYGFLEKMNDMYGDSSTAFRKLIVKSEKDNDKLLDYISRNNLKILNSNSFNYRYRRTLILALNILAGAGLLFVILSFLVFYTNSFLKILSSQPEIETLYLLGNNTRKISGIFIKDFSRVIISLIMIIITTQILAVSGLNSLLENSGFTTSNVNLLTSILSSLVILSVIWLTNVLIIRKYCKSLYK